MNLNLFQYIPPKELIAQHPLPQRDASRMMVLSRSQKSWSHQSIRDLPHFLKEGDLLVLNDTRVFPARIFGEDENKRRLEILLLEKNGKGWKCLAKPIKKIKEGSKIYFGDVLKGCITKKENGFLEVVFSEDSLTEKLEKIGLPPLPPYIRRKTIPEDKERYQSIFAKHLGSAAAPTASLHFTDELLQKMKTRGVETAYLTLHVSSDTFLPIRVSEITQHPMHGEQFFVPKETQEKIRKAKKEKRRVIAVGTTVVRALESDWSKEKTDLFITPGFEFKVVDGMLTNFHQPASTLLLLVSAFTGREFILEAYQEAITQKYRLFSYGDCMLIC